MENKDNSKSYDICFYILFALVLCFIIFCIFSVIVAKINDNSNILGHWITVLIFLVTISSTVMPFLVQGWNEKQKEKLDNKFLKLKEKYDNKYKKYEDDISSIKNTQKELEKITKSNEEEIKKLKFQNVHTKINFFDLHRKLNEISLKLCLSHIDHESLRIYFDNVKSIINYAMNAGENYEELKKTALKDSYLEANEIIAVNKTEFENFLIQEDIDACMRSIIFSVNKMDDCPEKNHFKQAYEILFKRQRKENMAVLSLLAEKYNTQKNNNIIKGQ